MGQWLYFKQSMKEYNGLWNNLLKYCGARADLKWAVKSPQIVQLQKLCTEGWSNMSVIRWQPVKQNEELFLQKAGSLYQEEYSKGNQTVKHWYRMNVCGICCTAVQRSTTYLCKYYFEEGQMSACPNMWKKIKANNFHKMYVLDVFIWFCVDK